MAGARSITERPSAAFRVPPIAIAAAVQFVGWVGASLLVGESISGYAFLILQGAMAALLGRAVRLPTWWLPILAAFPLLVSAVLALSIAPGWFLAAFLVLVAVYWSTFRTQVPLYLTGRQAVSILAARLPTGRPCRFLDIGSGTGTVLAQLARQVPDSVTLHGVELAPLPHAIAWLRSRFTGGRFRVTRENFWRCDLGGYDVVYAFLSPVPMPDLWRKVRSEMRPGSLFVSNTFTVPGVAPDETIAIGNGARILYVWRIR